jgi:hypothetical protein
MDGYQFIAAILQSVVSLAWPVAVFGGLWLFRKQLEVLLPNLRAKYKDVEISFRLEQAEKEARNLLREPRQFLSGTKITERELRRFEKVAELSPRAAILETRSELDDELRLFAERAGDLPAKNMPFVIIMRLLQTKELIDGSTFELLDDLRAIGNKVAHGPRNLEITKDEAIRYRELADEIIRRLATISRPS